MKQVLALAVLLFASTVYADAVPTATPTFEEVMPELALIGNDVTFQNVTPATLQAAIDAEDAAICPFGCMTTAPLYEAEFFADGSAFLFQVPAGTVVGTPEPSSLALALVGVALWAAAVIIRRDAYRP